MGLIKAITGAAGGVLADQWKEYFYCDALPADVICVKGQKRVSGRSSNKNGEDNIISNGSVIAVADGQCMIIVEQGKVVDICAESGEYTYDKSTEPSIFTGSLSNNISAVIKTAVNRFTFGGDTAKDQRVYYFNTKEMMGNKYGTPSPIPFRVVEPSINFTLTTSIRCFGEYSYRITNPVLFYTNVCGNVSKAYTRSEIDSQLKSELLTALQPAFGRISNKGIRYDQLTLETEVIAKELNEVLSDKWRDLRGIEIWSFGVSSVKAPEEDENRIKDAQTAIAYGSNAAMMAGRMGTAQANAMESAAKNANGAMAGFMGMNMASQAGGSTVQNLFQMGAQQAQAQTQMASTPTPAANSWTCPQCGTSATGKFCPECGTPKPVAVDGWTCTNCGHVNKGKFCSECGAKKPAGVPQYKCDKCGWEPEDPTNPPKFCPECGDPFGDEDITNK